MPRHPAKILNSQSVSTQADYVDKLIGSGGKSIDDEPRVPKGSPDGGQWTAGGGSSSGSTPTLPLSQAAEKVVADLGNTKSDGAPDDNGASNWKLSDRDKNYLDNYYPEAAKLSEEYGVDPALTLATGIESTFASTGTYLRTHDAFGLTGGSTKHMTTASSPEENVRQFFKLYGDQIRGVGSNANAFINGLKGLDRHGNKVEGWKSYNKDPVGKNGKHVWTEMIRNGIGQMKRDLPLYLGKKPTP